MNTNKLTIREIEDVLRTFTRIGNKIEIIGSIPASLKSITVGQVLDILDSL